MVADVRSHHVAGTTMTVTMVAVVNSVAILIVIAVHPEADSIIKVEETIVVSMMASINLDLRFAIDHVMIAGHQIVLHTVIMIARLGLVYFYEENNRKNKAVIFPIRIIL